MDALGIEKLRIGHYDRRGAAEDCEYDARDTPIRKKRGTPRSANGLASRLCPFALDDLDETMPCAVIDPTGVNRKIGAQADPRAASEPSRQTPISATFIREAPVQPPSKSRLCRVAKLGLMWPLLGRCPKGRASGCHETGEEE